MHSHAERGDDRGGLVDRVGFFASRLAPTGILVILGERACLLSGLAKLRGQFAQQDFSFQYLADDIVGLVARQTHALE